MSQPSFPQSDSDSAARRKGQIKLIMIFAIAGIPVLFAMAMYFGEFGIPVGKTNNGDLILPPVSVDLIAPDRPVAEDRLATWELRVVGSGACDDACTQMLYLARQVNVALGREEKRVSRGVTTTSELSGVAIADYEPVSKVVVSPEQFQFFYREAGMQQASEWEIFVVDPIGNVMMRYSDKHTGKEMLRDLKKLLKLSKIG